MPTSVGCTLTLDYDITYIYMYIYIYIYHRVILNLWFYLWVGVLNYFMIVGLFVGFMKLSWVHQRKIWFPKGTRDCVGFRVSYFYWTHWRVAGLLQCSLHSIHRGKPSVRLESSVSPSHVEMTEKKCECGTWGVSWTGGPQIIQYWIMSVLKPTVFGILHLRNTTSYNLNTGFFLTTTSVVFTGLHIQYICQYIW